MRTKHNPPICVILALFLAFSCVSYRCFNPRIYKFLEDSLSVDNREVENVYIVLVDGLCYDSVLSDMFNLSNLIYDKRASLIKARFNGPSYSRPGYARIFTGTPANINGIWRNEQNTRCKVPSIFEGAKKSGLTTGASAFYWIGELFNTRMEINKLSCMPGENIQYIYFYRGESIDDSKVFEMGEEIIKNYKPNLCLIHPMEVDKSGHRYGSMSGEYKKSVQKEDNLIKGLLSAVELDKSVVIITSDHGHTKRGGHGGNSPSEVEVPIVMIGSIISGGIYKGVYSHEDIAPTICSLLGIPLNRFMEGSVIDYPIKNARKYLMGRYNRLNKY